jgi:putative tricarboxylic transport membrane protein
MDKRESWRKIVIAAFLLIASAVLAVNFITTGLDGASASRGSVGPTTWPRVMLIGIASCAAVMLLRELARMFLRHLYPSEAAVETREIYDNRKAIVGIAILVVYGVAIPVVGFALATVTFLAVWLWLGGVRRAHTVVLVSLLGTIALLYLFAGLSKMPLDRGKGAFDALTVLLYRALGIY